MQIWQAVNLSAGVTNGRCPTDNTFIFADAAYREGDAGINAVTRTDQMNRRNFYDDSCMDSRIRHGVYEASKFVTHRGDTFRIHTSR